MTKGRLIYLLLYFVVGVSSLSLGLYVASMVIRSSYSQTQSVPSPAERLKEAASTGVWKPPSATLQNPADSTAPATPNAAAVNAQVAPGAPNANAAQVVPVNPDAVPFLEPYVFDAREGRRDPFRPPNNADFAYSDVLQPGTPMERYDLDELKLVGIMWDVANPRVMILDPVGDIHVLGKDDRIGRRRGYIAVIREGEVVIVETVNFSGENAYSTRILRLIK
jgi:type IV pilus assembly protein PilP